MHHVVGSCKRIVTSSEQLYLRLLRPDSTMGMSKDKFNVNSYRGHVYAFTDLHKYLLEMGRHDLAEIALRFLAEPLHYAFGRVNYFQYREELSCFAHSTLNNLLLSKNFGNKLRGMKLALIWLRSIFRPFIDKEKNK